MRHLHAFWTGEETDSESGLPHLAHAAWHCMVLFTFSRSEEYSDFDDRPDLPSLEWLSERIRKAYEN